jgi:hypothetical protein
MQSRSCPLAPRATQEAARPLPFLDVFMPSLVEAGFPTGAGSYVVISF